MELTEAPPSSDSAVENGVFSVKNYYLDNPVVDDQVYYTDNIIYYYFHNVV